MGFCSWGLFTSINLCLKVEGIGHGIYCQLSDGGIATLAGRLDMYDWKTHTIIDLKTTKFVKWQIQRGFIPRAEHILQVHYFEIKLSKL